MEEKALTKRQQQALRTKTRIRDEAWRLIAERGYENVSISDICGAAGVSNGNFYHYFSSKDDLLLFSYLGFDEFVKKVFSRLKFSCAVEAIKALIYEQVVGANDVGPKLEGQQLQAQLKLHGGYVMEKERYFHRYLKELVEKAQAEGDIHPSYEAQQVSDMLLQVSRGILFDWAVHNGGYAPERQAGRILDLLFQALRSPQPPESMAGYTSHLGESEKDEIKRGPSF